MNDTRDEFDILVKEQVNRILEEELENLTKCSPNPNLARNKPKKKL